MTPLTAKFTKGLIALGLLFVICLNASAQGNFPKSRIAVVSNETKTSIWVSDFPKQTSIVVMDSESNLLSIVTTNKFGAAYISIPQGVNSEVTVKTLDGEISASNKALVKKIKPEENVVTTEKDNSTKA